MKLIEAFFVLLIVTVVLAPKTLPRSGEWTSRVRLMGVQLQLDVGVGAPSGVRFRGQLSRAAMTITSVEFVATPIGLEPSTN
jgi:hypothetical protein